MKYTLTLSLFLGLISKDAAALRIQHHHHHHHGHPHQKMAQYDGDKQDWVPDCAPGRNPFIAGTGNAGTGGSYPGVGISCQGFAQRRALAQYDGDNQAWIEPCDPAQDTVAQKNPSGAGQSTFKDVGVECMGFAQKRSLAQYNGDSQEWVEPCDPAQDTVAQKNPSGAGQSTFPGVGVECMGFAQKKSLAQYDGDNQAWVEPCDPAQDTVAQKNPSGAGQSTFPGVGVECMGFAQRKSRRSLAQYDGDNQAWVEPCDPAQDTVAQKNPSGAGQSTFPGVGVECMGFAQRKSTRSLAQYNGDTQDWVPQCDPAQDTVAQKNPSGAGTYIDEKKGGSFPGVGVDCQGFAQRKSLAQYNGDSQDWVEPCDASQDTVAQKNPSGAGTYNGPKTKGSFPGVGVDCMGFAQRKSSRSLAQYNGDSQDWVEACDPAQDTVAQKNPSGAGTYKKDTKGSFPGVGVDCMGFAQKKSLAQYNGDSQDWVDKCDPTQDTVAQKNPNGAGTYEEALKGSFKGVGVDCQGFAQKKTNTRDCDGKPDCNGTNGKQGVDCC